MIRLRLRAMICAEIPLSAARVARVMPCPQMVTLVPGSPERGANPVISGVTQVLIRPIECGGVSEPQRPVRAGSDPEQPGRPVGCRKSDCVCELGRCIKVSP
jgi:hypothetical protein